MEKPLDMTDPTLDDDSPKTNMEEHPEWIDVIKLILPNKLLPNQSIIIETPFYVKLPLLF